MLEDKEEDLEGRGERFCWILCMTAVLGEDSDSVVCAGLFEGGIESKS